MQEPSIQSRPRVFNETCRFLIALGLVLALATALRTVGLGSDSLWNNEILSFQRASQPTLTESYELLREGTHPPLYSLGVLRPWFLIGDNEFFQRLPSAVFGVLTVALAFWLGSRVFGWKVGLLGAVLLALSPLHLYYSREGRMYALLALLTTLWGFSLIKAIREDSNRYWMAYALFGAASLYTHYYAGLALLSVAVYISAFLAATSRFTILKKSLVANFGIAILFSPWLPTLWYQLHNDPVSHLKPLTAGQILDLPLQFFTVFENAPFHARTLIAISIFGLGVAGLIAGMKSRDQKQHINVEYWLLVAATLGTLVLAQLVSLLKPIMYIRYFVGVVPLVCILLAFGALNIRPRILGGALYGILIVYSGVYSTNVLTEAWRPDFRSPTEHVKQHGHANDALLLFAPSDHPFNMAAFHHYYKSNIPVTYFYGTKADHEKLSAAIGDLQEPVQGIWVLQHREVLEINHLDNYRVTFQKRYRTRFFRRSEIISLAYLKPK